MLNLVMDNVTTYIYRIADTGRCFFLVGRYIGHNQACRAEKGMFTREKTSYILSEYITCLFYSYVVKPIKNNELLKSVDRTLAVIRLRSTHNMIQKHMLVLLHSLLLKAIVILSELTDEF